MTGVNMFRLLFNIKRVSNRVYSRMIFSNNLARLLPAINNARKFTTASNDPQSRLAKIEESVKEAEKSAKTAEKAAKKAEELAKMSAKKTEEAAREAEGLAKASEEAVLAAKEPAKRAKMSAKKAEEAGKEAEGSAKIAEEAAKVAKEAAKTTRASKGWRNRGNREEVYAALNSLQGLAFLTGVGIFYMNEKHEREKRKAELGRKITKDIEKVKTKLKFLINELDDFKRKTDFWKGLNKGHIDAHVNLEQINNYEKTFSYSMRMVSRYDTSLVPQVLQTEADYQNERLRRMTGVLLEESGDIEKTKKNLEELKKCFLDVYNVLNIVGIVTGANTIDKHQQSDEQKLLLKVLSMNKRGTSKDGVITDEITSVVEKFKTTAEDDIITDEARVIIHQFRKKQLDGLNDQKLKRNIDNSRLVRDEVFKPTA